MDHSPQSGRAGSGGLELLHCAAEGAGFALDSLQYGRNPCRDVDVHYVFQETGIEICGKHLTMENRIVLELTNVSKKFRKGEYYDCLRDLIPAMAARFMRREKEDQLSKDEFWALKDVSIRVSKGEAFGIIGPNGAGKSTLLKLLCGIMKPNLGEIRVSGTLSALIEVGAGFHPDLTGRENIFLNGTILGMKKEDIKGKFDEIVSFSGLESFIDTPVKRYSSGMYARLGFSVAAHVDPDILLVDEVLSVGDYGFQKRCFETMHP